MSVWNRLNLRRLAASCDGSRAAVYCNVIRVAQRASHTSRNAAHLVYFGAVFVEGHGVYALAGGVLLLIGVVGFAFGEDV